MFTFDDLNQIDLLRGHSYYTPAIAPGGVVIDAGAHRLEFACAIHKKHGTRVVAVEPNSDIIPSDTPGAISVINAALSDHDGFVELGVSSNLEASSIIMREENSARRNVKAISLEALLRQCGIDRTDLLKLDVEGAEFPVLLSASSHCLQSIVQISIEFHNSGGAGGAITAVLRRLQNEGFIPFKCSVRSHGDVLLLNRRFIRTALPFAAWGRLMLPVRRKILERRFA